MAELARFGGVTFDVEDEETLDLQNEITQHALESGARAADHIQPQPIAVKFTAIITGPDYEERYQRLRAAWQKGVVTDFRGAIETLSNCVIESMTPKKNAQIANGYFLDMVIRQIEFVDVDLREVRLPDPVTSKTAETPPKNNGTVTTKTESVSDTPTTGNKPQSILYRWLNPG